MSDEPTAPLEDEDGYQGAITLAWKGDHAPGLDALVIDDIRQSLWGLSDPAALCLHHVFLTPEFEGPTVFVWGEKGSPHFHCEYLPVFVWDAGQ